jgi:hypothetical protein
VNARAAIPPDARRLAAADKVSLAAEILIAYARTRWWLWRTDLRGALAELRRPRHSHGGAGLRGGDSHRAGLRLGSAVARTLRVLPTDSRCLMRSLVLSALLARRGIDARLVLGVRPGADFAAHAWVEHHGGPLLPPGNGSFQRLVEM